MKKLLVLLVFIFILGCEAQHTYSGMCKDKTGNRIIFSHFKMYNFINGVLLRNESRSMEIDLSEMDEIYMFKDGGKFDKDDEDNKDKESI